MSKIAGNEPTHWHSGDGGHRMTDPRKIRDQGGVESYPEKYWSPDERAYVAHLEEHERQENDPQRSENDSEAVRAVFNHIEHLLEMIAAEKKMIVALRQQEKEQKES